MKKLLLIALLLLGCWLYYQNGRSKEKLIEGKWRVQYGTPGQVAQTNLIDMQDDHTLQMTIKVVGPGGLGTDVVCKGTWGVSGSHLKIKILESNIPLGKSKDEDFGGTIKELDEEKLVIQTGANEETWRRVK